MARKPHDELAQSALCGTAFPPRQKQPSKRVDWQAAQGPGMAGWLRARLQDWQTRRALAQQPDHILRDIGLDPYQVRFEASQPLWKPLRLRRRGE